MARPLSPTDPSLVLQPQLNQGQEQEFCKYQILQKDKKMWGQTQGVKGELKCARGFVTSRHREQGTGTLQAGWKLGDFASET